MTPVEAEAECLEIANRLDDLLTSLPASSPPAAREALIDARDSLKLAASALADDAETG